MRLGSAILATAPIIWLAGVAYVLNVYEMRETFTEFKIKHANAQAGILQGGESLTDLFEYKAISAFQYADAMEAFLILGGIPAFLFCLALLLTRCRLSEYDSSSTKLTEELT